MPRAAARASVLVDHMPPLVDPGKTSGLERLTGDILRNYVDMERITYVTDLVISGTRPEHLEQQPLPVLIVGVRGDKGEPFGYEVMKSLNPHYTIGQFLASALGHQLTYELASFMKLDGAALKTYGLTAHDVRLINWSLARWYYLFHVGIDFFMDLGMKRREFNMNEDEVIATAALALNDDDEDDKQPALFKIDL